MSSTLACIGLAVADTAALGRIVRLASATVQPAGTFDGVQVTRWQDASGATLVLGWRDGDLPDSCRHTPRRPGEASQ